MNNIKAAIEAHPSLGWLGSLLAFVMSGLSWFIEHATYVAQVFGVGAAIFGFAAGYYTWRIQRDVWRDRQAQKQRRKLWPLD